MIADQPGEVEEPVREPPLVVEPAAHLDPSGTQTTADGGVKVRGWFDNEWGFSNRLLDLARLVGNHTATRSRSVSWSIA